MTAITVSISDDRLARLRDWAQRTGLTPEEFLHRRVDQLLDRPDQEFLHAAEYVLEKNKELYKRLS